MSTGESHNKTFHRTPSFVAAVTPPTPSAASIHISSKGHLPNSDVDDLAGRHVNSDASSDASVPTQGNQGQGDVMHAFGWDGAKCEDPLVPSHVQTRARTRAWIWVGRSQKGGRIRTMTDMQPPPAGRPTANKHRRRQCIVRTGVEELS